MMSQIIFFLQFNFNGIEDKYPKQPPFSAPFFVIPNQHQHFFNTFKIKRLTFSVGYQKCAYKQLENT